jgi:hypothetical protein
MVLLHTLKILKTVNSTHVRASLTQSTLKRLHGGTNGRLQLDDIQPIIQRFVVDNDLHVKRVLIQNPLNGCTQTVMYKHTSKYARFEILTAVLLTSCLLECNALSLGLPDPGSEGVITFLNVRNHSTDDTVSHLRRSGSSKY